MGAVDPILDIAEGNNDEGDEYNLIFVHISKILDGIILMIGLVNLGKKQTGVYHDQGVSDGTHCQKSNDYNKIAVLLPII